MRTTSIPVKKNHTYVLNFSSDSRNWTTSSGDITFSKLNISNTTNGSVLTYNRYGTYTWNHVVTFKTTKTTITVGSCNNSLKAPMLLVRLD